MGRNDIGNERTLKQANRCDNTNHAASKSAAGFSHTRSSPFMDETLLVWGNYKSIGRPSYRKSVGKS